MALAQICICGHTKTDHATIMRNGQPKRTQCGWYECECDTFKLKKMESINQGFVTLPTLIDCNEAMEFLKVTKQIFNHYRKLSKYLHNPEEFV